jgi:signal peptide peptidase SppA
MQYAHVVRWFREQPWALMPETFAVAVDMLKFRAAGGRLEPEEIRARVGMKAERPREQRYDPDTGEFYREAFDWETGQSKGFRSQSGSQLRREATVVSVLGVIGVISQRASQVDDLSGPGGTSTERLTSSFRSAMKDPAVCAIVFDVDSPGGGVYGVQELAAEIRAARGNKPIVAIANSLAASAAYWLASAADELVVTPSGEVGSIGVYAAHEDLSGALDQAGVKVTLVSAGKYKTEGNPFEPLSQEAFDAIQGRVEEYYQAFVQAVAKGRSTEERKVSPDDVRKSFGQGRVVGAKEALDGGMVDRIDTLDETVRRAGGRPARSAPPARGAASASSEGARMEAVGKLRNL